ncbi:MAG: hypothetical protein AMK70_04970 [Nitrospira bacterium SG8_35_1]|nr:MAG: hypothetical protein AMK70_04970 [Nitrospira bacterium SG8_35_1]
MKENNHNHLPEGQILRAVIDEQDLSGKEQQHLRECSACKRKVARIKDGLQAFGKKAGQAVPPLVRPVRLPSEKPARISHNAGWLPFFGAAATAGLLVFFYFMSMEAMPPSGLIPMQSQENLLEDESLMRQISEMVENPLSEEIYEISGENGVDFDEDFLQFVVPEIQDDFQSEIFIQGGIKRC